MALSISVSLSPFFLLAGGSDEAGKFPEVPPVDVPPPDVLPVDVLPVDVLPPDVLPVYVLPIDELPVDVLPADVLPVDVPVDMPSSNGSSELNVMEHDDDDDVFSIEAEVSSAVSSGQVKLLQVLKTKAHTIVDMSS